VVAIVDSEQEDFFMSDDRKDGPPPAEGLAPFFPMAQDDSAMIRIFASQARRAYDAALSSTTGLFGPPLPLVEAASMPTLLLQTVIVRGARTNEGTLIEAFALPWFDIIASLKTDPSIAFQIPCDKLEEIIAGAYKRPDLKK
jgi:hypothetical protein